MWYGSGLLLMVLLQDEKVMDGKITAKGDFGSETMIISLTALLLVVGLIVWGFVRHSRKDWMYAGVATGNEEIFARLCEANELSRNEIFTLRKMVYEMKLTNPLQPFVDPTVHDTYGRQLGGNRRAVAKHIRDKLFS